MAPDARSAKRAPPGAAPTQVSSNEKSPKNRPGTIWMKDGDFVRSVEVKTGTSDGVNTGIAADALLEGQEVVVGESSTDSQAATKNPFLPPTIKR